MLCKSRPVKGREALLALMAIWRRSASMPVQDGRTSLWTASFNGHLDTVKALIERRADVEAKDNVRITCLYKHVTHARVQ